MRFWCLTFAALCLALFVLSSSARLRAADERVPGSGFAEPGPLSFRYPQRRVKVVVLAGSIGAYRDQPYPRVLQEVCREIEVRNLSVVGMGARPLYDRFQRDVLPRLPRATEENGLSFWLLWNGGLNSVDNSFSTNDYIRRTFVSAHQRNIKVFALTLGPWGSEQERSRWSGENGLQTLIHTQRIVDFVLGRVQRRLALPARSSENEVMGHADIAVDLYNSLLRDRDAAPRDFQRARDSLLRSRTYVRRIAQSNDPTRLDNDARLLAEAPRWFLRPELQSFDTTHPNRNGHAIIAKLACEAAPAEWGCDCAAIPNAM